VSNAIALALIQHLIRTEQFDTTDVDAIADALERKDDDHAAHLVRLQLIEASAPTQAEWEADRRRAQFRVIPADGGNST